MDINTEWEMEDVTMKYAKKGDNEHIQNKSFSIFCHMES